MTVRPLTAPEIRDTVKALGMRPSAALGQNFLCDETAVRRVLAAGHVHRGDHVLHVGAGLGALTLALLGKGADVHAVDADPILARHLPVVVAEHCHGEIARLHVAHRDAVTLNRQTVAVSPQVVMITLRADLAANVALNVLAEFSSVRTVVLLTELDLTQRLAAVPGDPKYHPTGVKLRFYGQMARHGTLSPSAFWPAPRFHHGLLALRRVVGLPHTDDEDARAQQDLRARVFELIDIGFAHRRNSARHAFTGWAGSGRESARRLLTASIDPARRANDLSIADFRRLATRFPTQPAGRPAQRVHPYP